MVSNQTIFETILAIVLGGTFIYLSVQKLPRTGGLELKYHVFYVIGTTIIILLLPLPVQVIICSPLGVRVVASIYPTFESVRAVCTPGIKDDKIWLQYWVTFGVVFYTLSFFEEFTEDSHGLYLYFYHFEFFFFLWLLLPLTDGAALIYNYVTEPLLSPFLEPLTKSFVTWVVYVWNTFVSVTHILILWAVFIFIPPTFKRFIAISVGVVYPTMASLVALGTPAEDDDVFWLTYWSCYGCLFLVMDWSESFLGSVPGFYMIILFTTMYLMVPFSNGAKKVFRNVLVPLTGQQELLVYRDAYKVHKAMMASVPESRHDLMRQKVTDLFKKPRDDEGGDGLEIATLSPYEVSSDYQQLI